MASFAQAKHRCWLIRAASVPLLKILNVSIRPWMSGVITSSEILAMHKSRRCTVVHGRTTVQQAIFKRLTEGNILE